MNRDDLVAEDLHPCVGDPILRSMNLLNEVAGRFPDAIPFAAGRPFGSHYDIARLPDYLSRFGEHLAEQGLSAEAVNRTIFQYGPTKGIINGLVARSLGIDEGIHVSPEAIVITVGCQEALYLTLRALRRDERDVLISVSPAYVGVVGAARLLDLPVHSVAENDHGLDGDALVDAVVSLRGRGLRPRACYVVPDFANPSGTTMPERVRRRLLAVAEREDLLILEDNPYGLFGAAQSRPPTLKALDGDRRVIYLGTTAKTVFPGARVGYVVADQTVGWPGGETSVLADEIAKIKSMVTVNTSPIAQAMVAGRMLMFGCSLVAANAEERAVYRRNLRLILNGLARRFARHAGVSWNCPAGGFFVVVTVPFRVTDEALEEAGRDFRVLFTPMHHFYADGGGEYQLRLSCSAVTPDQIEVGLDRLAAFVRGRGAPA